MASPITTSTGLGSGLQITDIVTALVDADKSAKQTQITNQTAQVTARISGLGSVKSALDAFQTAMTTLASKTAPAFTGYAATSSNTSYVTATGDNTAVAGNYTVNVESLATGSKVASKLFTDGATSTLTAGGTLSIAQGTQTYAVDIAAGATLQEARDAINTKLQASGISANIITDSNGASRLVVSSTTTGAGSDLKLSGVDGLEIDGTQSMSASTDGSGYITAKAADAKFSIDGIAMTSASNTVSSAVSGLSLSLVAKGESTVTVATNTDGLKTSIQTFVDAYNTLIKTINKLQTNSTAADGTVTSGALTGDPTARSLIASVRSVLTSTGAGDKLTVLSQLGVKTTQADGTLEFDSTVFTSAMSSKGLSGEVQTMFTGSNGLLERMGSAIDAYNQTGGILDTKTTTLNKQSASLLLEQEALDRRVEQMTTMLTKRYTAMDTLVGQLKATATNITSMFDAINAQKNAS